MPTDYGIIVGRRPPGEILDAFRRLGHDLAPVDPERGTFRLLGRHARGRLRIHDDAAHYTWRTLCPMPHSIVEAEDDPALAASLARIVAGYGGFLRDRAGTVSEAPTPRGDNPGYDLIRALDRVPALDAGARIALLRMAGADMAGLRAVAEALSAHAGPSPDAPDAAPAP